MKKIILINGGIAGVIFSVLMLISHPLVENGTIDYDNGMLVGYATMVLALSMVFVGIKTYRDQVLKGVISFGQACKVGLLITLIASVIYAITWDVYYRVTASDFMEKYATHYVEKMKSEGDQFHANRNGRSGPVIREYLYPVWNDINGDPPRWDCHYVIERGNFKETRNFSGCPLKCLATAIRS